MKSAAIALALMGFSFAAHAELTYSGPDYKSQAERAAAAAPRAYCTEKQAQALLNKVARVSQPQYPATMEQISALAAKMLNCAWSGMPFRTEEGQAIYKKAMDDLLAKQHSLLTLLR